MKIFKFGGASVKDADSVKNVCRILKSFAGDQIITVISAMGKTTNALESVVNAYMNKESTAHDLLKNVKSFHTNIMEDLFADHIILFMYQ